MHFPSLESHGKKTDCLKFMESNWTDGNMVKSRPNSVESVIGIIFLQVEMYIHDIPGSLIESGGILPVEVMEGC